MVEVGIGTSSTKPIVKFTEIFEEQCPMYMSMGMTYEEFWEKDVEIVRAYRKANRYAKDKRNNEMWIQGMYIYDILTRVFPLYNSWAKTELQPYMTEPYSLYANTKEEQKEKEKEEMEKMRDYLEQFMVKQDGENNE